MRTVIRSALVMVPEVDIIMVDCHVFSELCLLFDQEAEIKKHDSKRGPEKWWS